MSRHYCLWVDGKWCQPQNYEVLHAPFSGEQLGFIGQATPVEAASAIEAAHRAFQEYKHMSSFRRSAILAKAADLLSRQRERVETLISLETAKPLRAARAEVSRTIETYRFAAEAAKSITGEQVAMDAAENGEGYIGFTIREPIGVITAITPFNFPLNLVAHKVAPALAAGNTIVLKPAEQAPLSALLLGELFQEAGLPDGVLNIITGKGAELGEVLTTHPWVKKISFTGSHAVGELVQRQAGLRRTTLELGSNATLIVDEGTSLDDIIDRCVSGAFGNNGQVCISLQRVLVHASLFDEFTDKLARSASQLLLGSPLEESTDVSSLISSQAAHRVAAWVNEAVVGGAVIVTGGRLREDIGHNIYAPTVLINAPCSSKVWSEEIFGPVVVLKPYEHLEEAIELVNESRYGLMAGIYTNNLQNAIVAARQLQVGGVAINDIPTFRVDQMPYGGVKDSGKGTEGIKYAIEEMTNLKLIVLKGTDRSV
ncbi:aldehyde dehydrogenase [Paenibacillus antibioticophila]|uniref:Aldehyde dehydrogenase n=1 Tax=Paenibacillus antibioticophila TaxID=1274374 RepID=A0A919XYF7_9BACL|nr:aldehyde dehydrogenase family protein [Paenibacillus antibioticophila]GIO38660.1 aldehyde dehydrogenase [Paenibacillus antibioticophila]